jgi:hypothetical protein
MIWSYSLIEFGVPLKLIRPFKMYLNGMYSKVQGDEKLSDNSLNQNILKQRDTLSPLCFNFASEYTIRKIQEQTQGKLIIYCCLVIRMHS